LKPDWLFLNDVMAVHDEREEAELYRCLIQGLPHTAIIAIGQRHSLEAFHDPMVALDASLGRPTRIVPMN
jgi:ABC-type uncharacterized transport system fused permease/ATPase subunit